MYDEVLSQFYNGCQAMSVCNKASRWWQPSPIYYLIAPTEFGFFGSVMFANGPWCPPVHEKVRSIGLSA